MRKIVLSTLLIASPFALNCMEWLDFANDLINMSSISSSSKTPGKEYRFAKVANKGGMVKKMFRGEKHTVETVKIVSIYEYNTTNGEKYFKGKVSKVDKKPIGLTLVKKIADYTKHLRRILVYSKKAKFGDNWFEKNFMPANYTTVGPAGALGELVEDKLKNNQHLQGSIDVLAEGTNVDYYIESHAASECPTYSITLQDGKHSITND